MDALKKRMIIRFTPYQTISHSKWMLSQNFGSNHPCCYTQYICTVQCTVRVYMVSAAPQPAAATFTFSSVFILLL